MIHLISYGNKKYKNVKILFKKEAVNSGWFDSIHIYKPSHIDEDFKEKFKDILEQPKGAGYWIWKSYFIKK